MAALAAYSIEVSAQEVEARRDVEIARVQEEGLRDRTAMVLEAKARALAQRLAFAKETGYLPPETSVERQALPEPIRQQVDDWRSKAFGAAMWSGLGVGTAAVAAAAGAWAWDRDEQRKAARGIIRSEIGSLGLRPPELG
jgi:anti-sigma-K factor RskA